MTMSWQAGGAGPVHRPGAPPPSSSYLPATGLDASPSDSGSVNHVQSGCCGSVWRRLFHRHDFRRPVVERLYGIRPYCCHCQYC